MATMAPRETTTEFVLLGDQIQKSLQSRITRHQHEVETCLTKVSSMLKEKADNDIENLAAQAAAVMLVLASNAHLTADALVIQTQLERASFLAKEQLDLVCIAKNISSDIAYKVSLEEAKRYGLV